MLPVFKHSTKIVHGEIQKKQSLVLNPRGLQRSEMKILSLFTFPEYDILLCPVSLHYDVICLLDTYWDISGTR